MPPLTVTLKDELSAVFPRTASSMTAEVSVMFRFAGGLQINDGVVTLQAELDHPGAACRRRSWVGQRPTRRLPGAGRSSRAGPSWSLAGMRRLS